MGILTGVAVGYTGTPDPSFSCGDQFGYYPDPADCSKYYICVFGDALHETCTGGLYFSTRLQTCDWPINTQCGDGSQTNDESHESFRRRGDVFSSVRRKQGSSPSRSSSYNYRSTFRNKGAVVERPELRLPISSTFPPPPDSPLITELKSHQRVNPDGQREVNHGVKFNSHYQGSLLQYEEVTPKTETPGVDLGINRPSDVSDLKVFVKPISHKNIDTETQTYNNKDKLKVSQIIASKDPDIGSYLALEEHNSDLKDEKKDLDINTNNGKHKDSDIGSYLALEEQNTDLKDEKKDLDINTNNGKPKDPDAIHVYGKDVDSYQVSGGTSQSNKNRPNEPEERISYDGKAEYLATKDGVRSWRRNNDKYDNPDMSLYTNNGHYKDTLSSLSPNNGRSKESEALSSLSRNNGHSKDPDVLPTLLLNNDHSKDPDITLPTLAPTLTPNRSHKLYGQPSLNHRSSHSDPKQSLQDPDTLDAQFGTNPVIVSVPDPPIQRNYDQATNSKSPVTRKVGPLSANNDPSPLSNYRDYGATNRTSPYETSSRKLTRAYITRPTTVSTEATTTTSTKRTPAATGLSRRDSYPKLAARPPPLYSTPIPLEPADNCSPNTCRLPDCRCGGASIPGDLPVSETPQVVLLTFDDAVNALNYDLYKEIFTGRKNPNGCPILGTFYVSHEWTDYAQVQTLYSEGHEMASHTISHSFGEKFSKNRWFKEVHGQREILHLYGGVKMEDVRGMRAPFLQVGGNNMFEMLYDANFTYDSSMPVFENNPPFWPYTLDYAINHECMITPCPKKSFPGLWEVGMVMWVDLRGGRCSMTDACFNAQDEEGVIKFFRKNFYRHYNSNRAPLGLFYHSAWFTTPHHKKGFMKFLDEILSKDDVWLITNWQLIEWLRNPTPISKLNSFDPWQCRRNDRPPPCHNPKVCNVRSKNGVRYMKTCQKCPKYYPWVGKTGYK
ncbi:uncharacterized protein LOC106473600 [Limulus polyphemus]|uniref:Uncharacterized protein LOC106473600 n=1 Tax=Limulus polyphemus TaxID=6850 RepID=A0ABM1BVZ2_LIMPO|nr:uncharacterized protein LOC106473600 [Limulus polyphemus]